MTTIMNTGAASLSDERERAAITACALMIKGICLTTPNAEWTERIENRIHYLLRQIATTPQADAAPIINGHEINDLFLKWSEWTTELGEAISRKNIDGFVSELRAAIAAGGAQEAVAWMTKSDGYVFYGYNKPDRVEEELVPLYAAPLPRVAATAWQPIETAPRDGANILIRFGSDGVSQAKYVSGTPHPWKFIDTNDGITWLINHAVDTEYGPTHWQPLPAASNGEQA